MIRAVNETVSHFEDINCYCVFYAGDEIVLRADNDAAAIKEGAGVIKEMDNFYNNTPNSH